MQARFTTSILRLGSDLRSCRQAAGLTQEELADRAGISVYTISNLERGKAHVPRSDTLHRWLDALSVPPQHQLLLLSIAQAAWKSPAGSVLPLDSAPLTSVIGRETDVHHLLELLRRPEVRLLSLLGPPGVGKTRLCLEAIRHLDDEFPDGIHSVDLAPVSDPTRVLTSIAQRLALRDAEDAAPGDLLQAHLHQRTTLVVLDNLEHVVDAAPDLLSLLAACPALKLLVTSRVALRVHGEHQYRVSPLPVPEPDIDEYRSLAELSAFPAVELFIARAAQIQAGFALSWDNAASIAQICRRLDGLPLALELAAAQLRLFSPRALLGRLEHHQLSVLASGPQNAPERHQSLQATLLWSYQLLPPDAQLMLRRLAVFVGGAPLEALESQGVQDSSQHPDTWSLSCPSDPSVPLSGLPHIMTLLDHHLVSCTVGCDGEPRLQLLETVRDFAQQHTTQSGDGAMLMSWHAHYFLSLAEAAESKLEGPEQIRWIERLEEEHENLRAALCWFYEQGELEACLRLAAALYRFWYLHGHYQEGDSWLACVLEAALRCEPDGESWHAKSSISRDFTLLLRRRRTTSDLYPSRDEVAERAPRVVANANNRSCLTFHLLIKALGAAARLAVVRHDYPYATSCHQQVLTLATAAGDRARVAITLLGLGEIARAQADFAGAIEYYRSSLAIRRELADIPGVASCLNNLGLANAQQGDYEQAREILEEGLVLCRAIQRPDLLARILANLGDLLVAHGDRIRARIILTESLQLRKALHDPLGTAQTLAILGDAAYTDGDLAESLRCYGESYYYYAVAQETPTLPYLLIAAANVHALLQHDELAIHLYAATCAVPATDPFIPAEHQRQREQHLAALSTAMPADEFAAFWASGAAWTIEQAADQAFAGSDQPAVKDMTQTMLVTSGGRSRR